MLKNNCILLSLYSVSVYMKSNHLVVFVMLFFADCQYIPLTYSLSLSTSALILTQSRI